MVLLTAHVQLKNNLALVLGLVLMLLLTPKNISNSMIPTMMDKSISETILKNLTTLLSWNLVIMMVMDKSITVKSTNV